MVSLAGRNSGAPAASKPASTIGSANAGSQRLAGSSSPTRPASTNCSTAAVVIALVNEAIQNTVSEDIGAGLSRPRTPALASSVSPLGSCAATDTPGSPAATAAASAASIPACALMLSVISPMVGVAGFE